MNRQHFPALYAALAAGFYGLAIILMGYAPFDYSDWRPAVGMWACVAVATLFVMAAGTARNNILKPTRR